MVTARRRRESRTRFFDVFLCEKLCFIRDKIPLLSLRVLVKYKFERVVLSLNFVHFTLISEINLCISTKSFL